MTKKEVINFRATEELAQAIRAMALSEGKTMSEFLTDMANKTAKTYKPVTLKAYPINKLGQEQKLATIGTFLADIHGLHTKAPILSAAKEALGTDKFVITDGARMIYSSALPDPNVFLQVVFE